MAGAHILIVEDEAPIRELLRAVLVQAGFEVTEAATGEIAMEMIRRETPDLLLLDWMLPGVSGPEVAAALRRDSRTRVLPIMMVTAKAAEADRVQGLDTGADDYVSKPFSPKELVARIKALLRRSSPEAASLPLEAGPLRYDPEAHEITLDGRVLELAQTEFKLLRYLMARPNKAFKRDQLLDSVWGENRFVEDRTVDVSIRRIRIALGEHGERMIQTVRGLGYKLSPDVEE